MILKNLRLCLFVTLSPVPGFLPHGKMKMAPRRESHFLLILLATSRYSY
jgi:hypothetical protein